ncbi:37S ribosomal protein S24, mitochondrial [Elsinoe australis]|uniref:superoxide dismutase n=1 Tax=Elsinoe australis TaxID=40998 RepID=A0A2P7YN91_9PEZI|nr:37S ribosomal protein S24, mitochondrial [Elsinoe australis]
MVSKAVFVAAVFAAVANAQGAATDAPISRGNPLGASYQAILAPTNKTSISGNIVVSTNPTQEGTNIQVRIDGLPSTGGPFTWHIHKAPIPADGNCTAALTHLDPYGRGETPPCDASNPASCEVGDQSGKWGKMGLNSTSYAANYIDSYVSTNPSDPAFVGGKSIVVHYPNKTRITCANFVQVTSGTGNSTVPGAGSPGYGAAPSTTGAAVSPTATSTPPPFTGGAVAVAAKGALALVAGGLAFAL